METCNALAPAGNDTEPRCRPIIWVVDDNEGFRNTLIPLLEEEGGYACKRQFPSAEAVLEVLREETPPDAILLDIQMGGMSGLEALPLIKQLSPAVRVLMCTSMSTGAARTRALRNGASDFLSKADPISRICSQIHQALETSTQDTAPIALREKEPSVSEPCPIPLKRPQRRSPAPNSFWLRFALAVSTLLRKRAIRPDHASAIPQTVSR